MARSASFHATDDAVHVAVPDLSADGPLESSPLRVVQVSPESLREVLAAAAAAVPTPVAPTPTTVAHAAASASTSVSTSITTTSEETL